MFLSNRGSFRPETSGAYTLRRRGRRRPKSGSAIGACAVARLAGSGGPIGDYYGSANSYSVPHRYAGRKVDLRVGESTLSIYHAGDRIATHRLLPAYVKNGYSTDKAHMPEAFLRPEWDDVRIRGWAKRIGPNCAAVVDRIFDRAKVREQAYNPSLSVLNLSKKYGEGRLEAACAHALPKLSSPRYKHLKAILDSGLDGPTAQAPARKMPGSGQGSGPKGHVRGADYYRE